MRRWLILGLGVAAQAVGTIALFGLTFVLPEIQRSTGASLAVAGVVIAAPSAGLMLMLIPWGALADRFGERVVISSGTAFAGLLLIASTATRSPWTLAGVLACVGGMGACANAAGGRLVLGWFAEHERGLAMGVRQSAHVVGVALAALTLPFAARLGGLSGALLVPGVGCLIVAALVAVFVVDPPRDTGLQDSRTASPYRQPPIWRIHAASSLLVIPHFAVATFGFVYIVQVRHWDEVMAGQLVAVTQVAAIGARVIVGRWADRLGRRLRPWRILTAANAASVALVAIGVVADSWLGVAAILIASVVTVSGNGLAFLAAGELAGPAWAGRALGTHNTLQNLTLAVMTPLGGALITAAGYGPAFAVAGAVALLAVPVIPVAADRSRA